MKMTNELVQRRLPAAVALAALGSVLLSGCGDAEREVQAHHDATTDQVVGYRDMDDLIQSRLDQGPDDQATCTKARKLGEGAVITSLEQDFPSMIAADDNIYQRKATQLSAVRINEHIAQPDDLIVACQDPQLTARAGGEPITIAFKVER